jgi:hypothetical protein
VKIVIIQLTRGISKAIMNCKLKVAKTFSGLIPVSIWLRRQQLPQHQKQNGGRDIS